MRRIAILILLGATMASAQEADFNELWKKHRDMAELEAAFREILTKAPGNLDYELQLWTQIARTLGLRAKFEEAHAVLDGVEKRLTDGTRTARVRYLLERGRAFNSSKKQEKALPLFLEAWELARRIEEHGYAVDAAHMVAIAEPDSEKKLAWNRKAMEYAEKSKDERALRWLGTLYNNIGWEYHDRGDFEAALEVHRKGWEWWKERAPDSKNAKIAKWSVSKQLRCLKRVDEALVLLRELESGDPDGFVHEEIGECLLLRGEEAGAKPHFAKAVELLAEVRWVAEEHPERWERLRRLAGK